MSPLPANVNEHSVELISSNALQFLADQQRRAESLQTRAGQIAGFAGATVALGAPLGARAFKQLDGLDELIVAGLYFGGSCALGLTVFLSVVFVLRPVRHYAIAASEIDNYLEDRRFVTQSPAAIRFRTLRSIGPAVARYEVVNETKAFWLKVSAGLFLAGLLMTIGVAVTLAADRL
jgi:hypothetical protein